MCAFLAPEPVPEDLFTSAAGELPGELAARAADPLAWRQTLAHLARQSLARVDQRGLVMHRLTQAILRDRLTAEQAAATRACTEAILAASHPGDPGNPVTWPRWAQLMPHLLAADLAATGSPGLRWMACDACWYLLARGDTRTAHDLAADLHQHWRDRLGDDHENTLAAAALPCLGAAGTWAATPRPASWTRTPWPAAAACSARTTPTPWPRRPASPSTCAPGRASGGPRAGRGHPGPPPPRARRGPPRHPGLGEQPRHRPARLGEDQAARELDEDTLARRRRVLGEDHPDTLASASNLAVDLRDLGEDQAARELDEDTLARRRRVLGEDHPDTLTSASNLAIDLRNLGEYQAARDLDEDTLARRRRVLGEDHPDTLASASNLAADLRALGEASDDP